jgi:hypothetical protein
MTFTDEQLELISEMSQEIHEKEQHIRSLYIWLGLLGVCFSATLMLLIF